MGQTPAKLQARPAICGMALRSCKDWFPGLSAQEQINKEPSAWRGRELGTLLSLGVVVCLEGRNLIKKVVVAKGTKNDYLLRKGHIPKLMPICRSLLLAYAYHSTGPA